jgi:hypothetical protein
MGLQVKHDLFINGLFLPLFDLTTAQSASDLEVSLPDKGYMRIDLKFDEPLKRPYHMSYLSLI